VCICDGTPRRFGCSFACLIQEDAMQNDDVTEDDIRRRAHELWKEWGRPDAAGDKFWLLAEQELVYGKPSNGERDIVKDS
jgi:Protein of unknown function (DUF2934)